ncbi:MAG: uracil-DNA glycosylase family protein [Sphingobium sp.]
MQMEMAAAADAYMAWWALAGVDCAIGEAPVNWLRPVAAPSARSVEAELPAPSALPAALEAFRAWALADPAQPERIWAGAPILPIGDAGTPLLIVSDMPDQADMAAGALFTGKAGELLDAMLRAIGVARADAAMASLFFARPPGGMVDAASLDGAADRMRRYVMLARPARVLLLGDRAGRALLPQGDGSIEDGLRTLNHDGGTVPAIATFHPRLLLGQPAAKAECWRALTYLIEEQHR